MNNGRGQNQWEGPEPMGGAEPVGGGMSSRKSQDQWEEP